MITRWYRESGRRPFWGHNLPVPGVGRSSDQGNSMDVSRSTSFEFFLAAHGNAQRLPNGNTLINEASFGRFFEVTRDGEIVWEYVNPYLVDHLWLRPTRSSGRFVTAQRRSLVQKPRLELEYFWSPIKPRLLPTRSANGSADRLRC